MRYVMRQKLLSPADSFTIKNENGDRVVATVSKRR
jgi:uncharacterized protein YxjI